MWAANAATVLPSPDTADGRVHFVPANLSNERHRALETPFTARLLRAVFSDPLHFAHHEPLPLAGDEGAANHTRLCPEYGSPGLELFVHGPGAETSGPTRHPARQHADASRAVARLGRLAPGRTRFFGQLPEAIDAGVFHNDVIATGDRSLLFLHQDAFVDQAARLDELRATFARELQGELRVVEVERDAVPLAAAVSTYLFHCQVVRRPDGRCAWIGPLECLEEPSTAALLEALSGSGGPFDEIHFVDLRESMRNGGGPACLRLRVVLTEAEERARHHGIDYDAERDQRLRAIVERHYREHLDPADLADPALMDEARRALDAITDVLGLGSVYDFQRA